MTWTLQKLIQTPDKLNLPLRPIVNNVADKGDLRNVIVDGFTYRVRYFSKGGSGAEGAATLQSGTVSLGVHCDGSVIGGANAYLLPWAKDQIYLSELAQKHRLFFTAKLNGCAMFIAGGRCNPTVVHANAYTKIDTPASFAESEMRRVMGQYETIYTAMAQNLVGRGELDPDNLAVFRPGVLGYTGDAAVFGVRAASQWAFYAVIGSAKNPPVHKIWPA